MPTRGVDDSKAAQNIDDEFVAAAQNARFRDQDWQQRGGYAPHIESQAAASAVTGIRFAKYSSGTSRLFVATAAIAGSANLFRKNGTSWSSVKGALTLNGTKDDLFWFFELNDFTIGSNGKNQLFKVSDSVDPAVALGGTPPANARAGMGYRNRAILGSPTANPASLFWSAINAPENYTAASSGSATPALNAGQRLTALAACGTDAFVFYERLIFAMNPTNDDKNPFRFDEHDAQVGAANQNSVVSVPNRGLIFFANALGIYRMAGAEGYRPFRVSHRIDGTWRTINKTRVSIICGGVLPDTNEVWFTCSTGSNSTNSYILVYDYDRDVWNGGFVGMAANYLANAEDSNGDQRMLFGDYAGFVYDTETGDQDKPADASHTSGVATAIDFFVTSKEHRLIDGRRRSSVWEAEFEVDGGGADATIEFNHGYDLRGIDHFKSVRTQAPGGQWDTDSWDTMFWATEGPIKKRIKIGGKGQYFQYQFRNRLLNNPARVYGLQLGLIDETTYEEAA